MEIFNSLFALLYRHKKTLLLILLVSTATILISSAVSIWLSNFHNLTLPTIGTIKTIGVEVYWDSNLQNKTEIIDWNTVWPGTTKNATLYIRNVSNVKTTLHLNTSNIDPANISEYLNLSWNYDGSPLNPNETIQVTLFLSASDDILFISYIIANELTAFNLDIQIAAYE